MSKLDEAFEAVPRIKFLRPENRALYQVDVPLSIGYQQTNSQPSTVRMMLRWLDPQTGDKVLDVGSGSGWTTALLAYLVGSTGTVYAVEKIAELMKFGQENCRRLNIHNVRFFQAGKTYGLPAFAPYDRILVSAAAATLPNDLLDQLKVGGRIVIPTNTSINVIDRLDHETYEHKEHPGFVFVPLV
jgi:protein-L-isoaspartate(D-aspartate) O-methyltransferase